MNLLILKNISWLLLERGSQVIGVFIISGLVSRQLGVVAYGEFQYVLSIILLFSVAGLICSSEVLLPKIVKADEKNVNILVVSGFLLRLAASSIAYSLILIYGYYYIESERIFYLLCTLGLTVLLREPFAVALVYFQSKTYSKPVVIASITILLLKTSALVFAYYFKFIDFNIILVVWVAEALGLSLAYSFLYFREIKKRSILICWGLVDIKKLFKEGIVYWVPLILMTFFWRIDRILVKEFSSAHEAGLYLAAMQLFDAVVSVAIIVSISMAPSLIYQYSDAIKIKENTKKLVLIMLYLGVVSSTMCYFLAPYIVLQVFGVAFVDAIPIAQTAFCITVLAFVDAAFNVNLIKRLGAKYALVKWIIVVIIALPVEYFSIRLWGAQGAHVGITAGYISALIFGVFQLKIK